MEYLSQFEELKEKEMSLDLTRGKPASDQLDLSRPLDSLNIDSYISDGVDIRNYGQVKGLYECRKLGSKILGCNEEYVWAGGNSSLTLMSQYLSYLCIQGVGDGPWSSEERVSVLCPVPGYDRHFFLSESLGINMIPVPLTGQGPDLNLIRSYIESDDSIRGIWCVPKHSNPTGETYSKETIEGLIDIFSKTRKKSRIFWDNAYAVHDFSGLEVLEDIFSIAKKKGSEDLVVEFGSTSKITYSGAGIGFIALSQTNQDSFLPFYSALIIGPDKLNQKRHIRFFEENELLQHMRKHADLIKPKFELVQKWLSGQEYGSWTRPTGGYFVLLKTKPGLAKRIISLASELGLKLTPAGSTHPYGVDPEDQYLRIAPTACSIEELDSAMEILVCCLGLANQDN
ncbi:MAG TPA: aminotransferase class I/II-fold pyridoxal phosphate-dependent enzyme [SAR86 cluster bacterium]|nr:aminotransferase class I/II-fold pyridoxal phosphate-dependent enzyme [SAR86 cluster bacterium]|tara:strand:+ start:15162 stop:16355 length:1194 start_codon:yes stop_codon:yes gene_type:complete